ncbi:hypothetical protein MKW98_029599 [Papaver atlanticum]|uniref:Uncharacterized protein n=1 Tax=Papaver atlanticum TaxID=357466 RepID=A0AAD4T5Z8_9MAGN|nr:hypothetical protein MKW98_029599 [Papaver atlanticum]
MALRTAGRFISGRLFGGSRNFSGNSTHTEDVGATVGNFLSYLFCRSFHKNVSIKDSDLRILYKKILWKELDAKKIQAEHKKEFDRPIEIDTMITTFLGNLWLGAVLYKHLAQISRGEVISVRRH